MNSSFINQLANHIKDNYDLRNQELTVIFPNKRAAFYLRTLFQEIYDETIWLPQMLSVEEAMEEWSGVSLIDNIDMLFELIAIDTEIKQKDGDLSVFGSMAAQMAKDFDEIDQYKVDADKLFSYIQNDKEIEIWIPGESMTPKDKAYFEFFTSLKEYYRRLRQRLESQGKGYYGMITRSLSELSDEELVKRVKGRHLIFAGFNALTPTEQLIINKLYKSGLVEVIWDFDQYYVDDKGNEAGYFARQYRDKDYPWKPTSFSDSLRNDAKEIHLVSVTGNTIQAKALQHYLQQEQDSNTSIILADEELLIPVLNSIPDKAIYPNIRVSMGYPIRNTSLMHLVDIFFHFRKNTRTFGDNGWYIWPIYKTFDFELIHVLFKKKELEELDSFRSKSQRNSLFIFQVNDFMNSCPSPDVQRFMGLLLGFDYRTKTDSPSSSSGMLSPQTPSEALMNLSELLSFIADKVNQQRHGNDSVFLLNQISMMGSVINRLKNIITHYQRYVQSIDDLETLFTLISNNVSIKLNSSSTDGLQVMGLLEARNLDFDSFYMLGVNEGMLPIGKPKGSFIPYFIRMECGLPGYEEKQAVYAYHFYRLLQSGRRVYFLYNASNRDAATEPSRFLLQLKYELPQFNPHIHIIEESFCCQPQQIQAIPNLQVQKDEATMNRLLEKLQSKPQYALAPTSITTYLTCPLQFYLKCLMRIKDEEAEERTQSNVIGTVIHATLENLYKDFLNESISHEFFKSHIEPLKNAKLEQAIKASFGQGIPTFGYNYLDRVTIEEYIQNYIRYELNNLEGNHQIQIVSVEDTLSTTLVVNGVSCVLAGKADRIDSLDHVYRIIDYKTGSVSDKDVVVPADIESLSDLPAKALQLLIYKYLYLKQNPQLRASQVTASLFALRYKKIAFDLDIQYQPLIDDFVGTMEAFLTGLFQDMLNKDKPFVQILELNGHCKYCDFLTICSNASAADIPEDGH